MTDFLHHLLASIVAFDYHHALVTVVAFIVLIGVMIVVHEFGHFAVAKLCKVRVEAFSFGFGPRLFGYKYGDTDYKVCLLPLGGYVKMAGENFAELSDAASGTATIASATPAPSPLIPAGSRCSSAWLAPAPTSSWPSC